MKGSGSVFFGITPSAALSSALISIRSSLDIQAAARAGVKALGLGARQSGKSQKLAPPAIAGWLRRRG